MPDSLFTIDDPSYGQFGSLEAYDADSDGDLDVSVKTETHFITYLQQPDGEFRLHDTPLRIAENILATPDLVSGDFTSDGITDFAVFEEFSGLVAVLEGDGGGSFTRHEFSAPIEGTAAGQDYEVLDVNGDGALDIVSLDYGPSGRFPEGKFARVVFGDGVGGFFNGQTVNRNEVDALYIEVADVTSDGLLDLIAYGEIGGREVNVFRGLGDGQFSDSSDRYTLRGDRAGELLVFDVNGDRHRDIVLRDSYGYLQVMLADGTGGFGDLLAARVKQTFPVSRGSRGEHSVEQDLNLDGMDDYIFLSLTTNEFSILYGDAEQLLLPSYSLPQSEVVSFTYDPTFNQLTSITDELGRQTFFEIDTENGNTLSQTRVVGELDTIENGETDDVVTGFEYYDNGLIRSTTDPLGRVTNYDYNTLGRLERITFAVGTADEAPQQFEYDAAGNQTAVVDENGNRTEFEFDDMNRLTRVIEADPDGAGPLVSPETELDYDEAGNLIRTVDAKDNTVVQRYDAQGRLVRTTTDGDETTRFEYDFVGNIVAITDPLGQRIEREYDGRNRLVATIDPNGGRTTFGYDADNNLRRPIPRQLWRHWAKTIPSNT